MKLEFLGVFLLSVISLEILVRRWAWEQLPTQIPGVAVYALLVINALFIYWRWNRLRQSGAFQKNQKS